MCLFLGVVEVDVSAHEAAEATSTLRLYMFVRIDRLMFGRERGSLTNATGGRVLLLTILAALLLSVAALLAVTLLLTIALLLLTFTVALLLSVSLLRLA